MTDRPKINKDLDVKRLFKIGQDGLAIPEYNPDAIWMGGGFGTSALITVKLDGVLVKILEDKLYTLTKEGDPDHQQEVLAAYNNSKVLCQRDGYYIAFGPGILDNRMQAPTLKMMSISPNIDNSLIVLKAGTNMRFGWSVSAQDCFNSIKAELEASPEISGVVFLYESAINVPEAWASADRKDFGLPYPVIEAAPTVGETVVASAIPMNEAHMDMY